MLPDFCPPCLQSCPTDQSGADKVAVRPTTYLARSNAYPSEGLSGARLQPGELLHTPTIRVDPRQRVGEGEGFRQNANTWWQENLLPSSLHDIDVVFVQ